MRGSIGFATFRRSRNVRASRLHAVVWSEGMGMEPLARTQEMPGEYEHLPRQRHPGNRVPLLLLDSPVEGVEAAPLRGYLARGLHECGAQPDAAAMRDMAEPIPLAGGVRGSDQAGEGRELARGREAAEVPDLRHDHEGGNATDARNRGENLQVLGLRDELNASPIERPDMERELPEDGKEVLDFRVVRRTEVLFPKPDHAPFPERVRPGGDDAMLAENAGDAVPDPGSHAHEERPAAHELPEVSRLSRRAIGLRQEIRTHHVGERPRINFVVLEF